MPNSRRAQAAQIGTQTFPWANFPPWKTVTTKPENVKEGQEQTEHEVKWTCMACGTDHHNARKQTCRVCGEARQAKPGPKGKLP